MTVNRRAVRIESTATHLQARLTFGAAALVGVVGIVVAAPGPHTTYFAQYSQLPDLGTNNSMIESGSVPLGLPVAAQRRAPKPAKPEKAPLVWSPSFARHTAPAVPVAVLAPVVAGLGPVAQALGGAVNAVKTTSAASVVNATSSLKVKHTIIKDTVSSAQKAAQDAQKAADKAATEAAKASSAAQAAADKKAAEKKKAEDAKAKAAAQAAKDAIQRRAH